VPKVVVDAKEALADIRSGLSDSELSEKYGLSAVGLQSLFSKLLAAGLITEAELSNRVHWSQKDVKLRGEDNADLDGERVAESVDFTKTKVRIDPRRVVSDIRYGFGDSELMDKYNLSPGGFRRLVRKLLLTGLITQSEPDNRQHWTDKSVKLERYVCPSCNMPQFHVFELCPQCGIIVSKYPKEALEGKNRKDFWTIKTRTYLFKLKRNGSKILLRGLDSDLQKDLVYKVRNLLAMKLQKAEETAGSVGSHFWATLAGGVNQHKKTSGAKEKKFFLIRMGLYTMKPSVDGSSLTIQGLREGLQREIVAMIQRHLETHDLEQERGGRIAILRDHLALLKRRD